MPRLAALKVRLVLVLTILGAPLLLSGYSHAASGASKVASNFQATLVEVMKDAKNLGIKGRYDKLKPAVTGSFDLALMAAIASGSHWQSASNEQKRAVVDAFGRMSISTLATLLDGYDGEKFELVDERPGPQGTTLVDTVLKREGKDDVKISYVAYAKSGEWRLIDVLLDAGISQLRVHMSEFHTTLKNEGIVGLIRVLNAKADQLLK